MTNKSNGIVQSHSHPWFHSLAPSIYRYQIKPLKKVRCISLLFQRKERKKNRKKSIGTEEIVKSIGVNKMNDFLCKDRSTRD